MSDLYHAAEAVQSEHGRSMTNLTWGPGSRYNCQGPAEYFVRTYESTAGSHISLSTTSWLVSFLSILHDLCHTAQGPDWCSNPSDSLVYNLRGLCIFMEENEELKNASSDTLERFDDAAVTRAGLEEFARAFKYRQGALPWLPSDGARVESILSGGHSDALAERAAEAEMAKAYWTIYSERNLGHYKTTLPHHLAAGPSQASLAKSTSSAFVPVARDRPF
ncbi:hypothetical protein Rhopal_002480-T1 [Rhodotorula paludigena]|uniref:Uncharacterized protein n=1 Tax=Rhodotorula paludigena TaxID=86838 RepID=A0AAV5GH07_9BASI|nr:hypothetical protein Rhopal_002480-T1 [Rhodotorula paludigena]